MSLAKAHLNKEETNNIIKMLRSPEEDNRVIALTALNEANLTSYVAELLVIYNYAKISLSEWEAHCPNAFAIINPIITSEINGRDKQFASFTSGDLVRKIITLSGSKTAIELMLEHHVEELTHLFEGLGYKFEDFSVNVKFKDE